MVREGSHRMAKVGILHSGTARKHDKHINPLKNKIDITPGHTILPPRFASDNKGGELHRHAQDLVMQDNVDVLVAAGGTDCAGEANWASHLVKPPKLVVFTSVGGSFVPADNMTGICARTSDLDAVRLYLLHEFLPASKHIGVLTSSRPLRPDLQQAAVQLGLTLRPTDVGKDETKIKKAFTDWAAASPAIQGVIVTANPFFNNHREEFNSAAGTPISLIPTIYQWREFADEGGLISYGPNLTQAYQLAGTYVDNILNHRRTPADLPIVQLTKSELVINRKTANALGLTVPQSLLDRADDVIT